MLIIMWYRVGDAIPYVIVCMIGEITEGLTCRVSLQFILESWHLRMLVVYKNIYKCAYVNDIRISLTNFTSNEGYK